MAETVADKVIVELQAKTAKYLQDLSTAGNVSTATAKKMQEAANSAAAAAVTHADKIVNTIKVQKDSTKEQLAAARAAAENARAVQQSVRAEASKAVALNRASQVEASLAKDRQRDEQKRAADAARAAKAEAASMAERERAINAAIVAESRREAALQKTITTEKAVAAAAVSSAAQVRTATTAMNQSSGAFNANVGNIAAQFQDIGVTAYMGMSPMLVGFQQGTQLAAVFNQSLSAGISPARALASAFMQVVNPTSLITIGLTAATTAAIQYFMTLGKDGGKSETELKAHQERIKELGDRWGAVVPAIKQYAEEVLRLQNSGDAEFQKIELLDKNYKELRKTLEGIDGFIPKNTPETIALTQEQQERIADLSNTYADFQEKVRNGTATQEDANEVSAKLAAATDGVFIPALSRFANGWRTVQNEIQRYIAAAKDANQTAPQLEEASFKKYIEDQQRLNGLSQKQLEIENEKKKIRSELERNKIGLEGRDADIERQAIENIAASEKRRNEALAERKSLRESEKMGRKWEDELKDAEKNIALIHAEGAALAATNPFINDYGFAIEYAKKEQELLNEAKAAGITIDEALKESVKSLAFEQAAATVTLAKLKEEYNETKKVYEDVEKSLSDAGKGFIKDIVAGKSAVEALTSAVGKLADKMFELFLNDLFKTGGGSSGGGLGALIGGVKNFFGGFRANGGGVSGSKSYIVGERGAELFIPNTAGTIVPNNVLNSMPSISPRSQSTGAINVNYAPIIDARGSDASIMPQVKAMVDRSKQEFMQELPSAINDIQRRSMI